VREQLKWARDHKYSPDFSKAFEHFLLHTGGRGVIETLETELKLSPKQAQPSKVVTLQPFPSGDEIQAISQAGPDMSLLL